MSKYEGRGGIGHNWDVCIFERQLNNSYISVLDKWLKDGFITGYCVSPEHKSDTYNFLEAKYDKNKPEGGQKPSHLHIAVSFTDKKETEDMKTIFEPLYSPVGWAEQEARVGDYPYYLYDARGRVDYYLHWNQAEKHLYDSKDLIIRGSMKEDEKDEYVFENDQLVKKFDPQEISTDFIVYCEQDPKAQKGSYVDPEYSQTGGLHKLQKLSRLNKWDIYIEEKEVTEDDYDSENCCIDQKGLRMVIRAHSPTTVSAVEHAFTWYKKFKNKLEEAGIPKECIESVHVFKDKEIPFECQLVTKEYAKTKEEELRKVEGEIENDWEFELEI